MTADLTRAPGAAGPDAAPEGVSDAGMFAVLGVLSNAMTATMLDLGRRTGLNAALAAGPAEVTELAARAGGDPRITAEWLHALVTAGLVTAADGQYAWIPPAAAAFGAPAGSPQDLSAGVELFSVLSGCVPLVADAFGAGGGVPAERYPGDLATAMQRMSVGWTAQVLPYVWVPAVPGLTDRLAAGGAIAEIGSGAGEALEALVRTFPAATATGFELDARGVRAGSERLAAAGLADRVRLLEQDAATGLSGPYDLVLALSVLHDVPDLDRMLAAIAASLAPDGVLLVVESPALSGPMAGLLLATSTLYCVPSTLARGGPAAGTLGLPPSVLVPAAARAGLAPVAPLPNPVPLVHATAFRRA